MTQGSCAPIFARDASNGVPAILQWRILSRLNGHLSDTVYGGGAAKRG